MTSYCHVFEMASHCLECGREMDDAEAQEYEECRWCRERLRREGLRPHRVRALYGGRRGWSEEEE